MTNNTVKYEVFVKQYLRAILDMSGNPPITIHKRDLLTLFPQTSVMIIATVKNESVG